MAAAGFPPPAAQPAAPAADAGHAAPASAAIDDGRLRAAIDALLPGLDAMDESVGHFRRRVAVHLGLPDTGLDDQADRVSDVLTVAVNTRAGTRTPAERMKDLVESLGAEDRSVKNRVYLATISRLLPDTMAEHANLVDTASLTREALGEALGGLSAHAIVILVLLITSVLLITIVTCTIAYRGATGSLCTSTPEYARNDALESPSTPCET